MTAYPPTHLLQVHVPDPTPDSEGDVRCYLFDGYKFYAPAADLTPIPPEDLPIEVRFPVGSVWRFDNGDEAEITDTRLDRDGEVACWMTYPAGNMHGSASPDDLATAERVR